MKKVIFVVGLFFACGVFAQSSFERDLEALNLQLEEDLAKATAPIHSRHKASLETLLQKAVRNGDVDAALKIREASCVDFSW